MRACRSAMAWSCVLGAGACGCGPGVAVRGAGAGVDAWEMAAWVTGDWGLGQCAAPAHGGSAEPVIGGSLRPAEGIISPHFSLDICKDLHNRKSHCVKYPSICWWWLWNANCTLVRRQKFITSAWAPKPTAPEFYCTAGMTLSNIVGLHEFTRLAG